MKTKQQQVKLALAATMLVGGLLTSCKKDKDKEPEVSSTVPNQTISYALGINGGTSKNLTTYFLGTSDFPSGIINTSSAAELGADGVMTSYNGFTYMHSFGEPATLRKFGFDANGKPTEVGKFAVSGLKTFGAIYFISPTEAYAAVNGLNAIPMLVRFNPTSMARTGIIDLSAIKKTGAANTFYQGLVHRDGLLYMGVYFQKADWDYLADSAFVAIIDLNSQKYTKLISDGRTGIVFGAGTKDMYRGESLVIDENKDIYVSCIKGSKVPSGVLRIKNGETTYDPTYFFDLKTATGGECLGIFNYGNGKALTLKYTIDNGGNYPNESSDPGTKPEFRYYKIDLSGKTSLGDLSTTLPNVFSNNAFITKWDVSKAFFNVNSEKEDAIWELNKTTGVVNKSFTSKTGGFVGFAKLN